MYKIDIEQIVKSIKKEKAKRVLLQLPDGLKPKAVDIATKIKEKVNVEIIIWAGSNFGGCDVPNIKEVDLVINVGHSEFLF